jgi:WD40 repeat protein
MIDNNRFASASFDSSINIWNMKDINDIVTLLGHDQPITALAYINDGKLVSGA